MSLETATRFLVASHSEIGRRRQTNQDRSLVRFLDGDALLLAVADGMGGQAGGEIAAQVAVNTLAGMTRVGQGQQEHLAVMIKKSSYRVMAEAERRAELRGMGCTLTVALVENDRLFWGHVGDSRLYLYRQRELFQITTDQNMAWRLVKAGRLTPAEARLSPYRHLLDQCVGCASCQPVGGTLEIRAGDWLLLSTDGLHNELSTTRLTHLLAMARKPERAVRTLVQAALNHGGGDNITAMVAEVQE
jgi:PPM family protein phosphatase